MNKWDNRFLNLAKHIGGWSKDPRTQVGAVITKGNRIVSLGFNGFPEGIADTDSRLATRKATAGFVLHAEENALLFAKQDMQGATIYTSRPPCPHCALLIVQSKISRVISIHDDTAANEARYKRALEILTEAKVQYDCDIPDRIVEEPRSASPSCKITGIWA